MEEFNSLDTGAVGGIFAFLMAYLFFVLAITVIIIISYWKIFEKAGKPGWASLIPVHNIVVMLEIARKPVPWIFIFIYAIIVPIVGPIAALVFYIMMLNGISKNFGYGAGFTVGLFFLPLIFLPILAFGSSKYIDDESTINNTSLDVGEL